MSPSSTKSSPSSGSITLVRASCTSSTVGMPSRVVGSAGMPLLALVAIFIVVPLAELYVILKVGDAIGAVPTILLLAADSVIGSLLLRAQGRVGWRLFNEALAVGRMPHREV